jgi:hypothetical protein
MSEVTPEQSILRVDMDAGGWEAITTALINDERLEFDTRGFAAWLLARPDAWQIKAAALPHLLKCNSGHVGRDKARRFLRELEHAGYLTRTRRQGADGRWIWDYFFRPTSPAPTVDASPVGGSPVDGLPVDGQTVDRQAVDITHTLITSRSDKSILDKTTTTTAPPEPETRVVVGDLSEIRYPDCLTGSALNAAKTLMRGCPPGYRQPVLDELGALITAGRVRKPSGLLYRLIERAKVGQFAPNWSAGPVVSKAASEESRKNIRGSLAPASQSQPRIVSEAAADTLRRLRLKFRPTVEGSSMQQQEHWRAGSSDLSDAGQHAGEESG